MTGLDLSLLMAFHAVAGYLAMRPVAAAIKNGAIRNYNQVVEDYHRDLEILRDLETLNAGLKPQI